VTEPILSRDEALGGLWLLADILAELRAIREWLEDGEEEGNLDE
jgi:hypothetical protein